MYYMDSRIKLLLLYFERVCCTRHTHYESCLKVILQTALTKCLVFLLDVKSIELNEELILNTVATLNNLSFYQGDSIALSQRQLDITEGKKGV